MDGELAQSRQPQNGVNQKSSKSAPPLRKGSKPTNKFSSALSAAGRAFRRLVLPDPTRNELPEGSCLLSASSPAQCAMLTYRTYRTVGHLLRSPCTAFLNSCTETEPKNVRPAVLDLPPQLLQDGRDEPTWLRGAPPNGAQDALHAVQPAFRGHCLWHRLHWASFFVDLPPAVLLIRAIGNL